MKKSISLCLFILFSTSLIGQSLTWNWAKSFQRLESERTIQPEQLFVDAAGNSYVVGNRRATILIDGDSLAFPTQVSQPAVFFVSKFDLDGQNVWTKSFDSEYRDVQISVDKTNRLHIFYRGERPRPDQGYAFIHQIYDESQDSIIAVDTILTHDRFFLSPARHKFHVDEDLNTFFFVNNVGVAEDQVKVMGVDTTFNITSRNGLSILKYNQEGQLLWRQLINADEFEAFHFAINDQGELTLAGHFTEFLVVEGDTLVGETANTTDIYCLQFNADGSLKWQRKFGIHGSHEYINQVQAKGQDIYLAGTIDFGTQLFDQLTLEVLRNDPYLLKLNAANGSVQDVINLPLGFSFAAGRAFTIDEDDNIFLFGEYTSSFNLLGPDTLPSASGISMPRNLFVAAIEQKDSFQIKNGFAITGSQDLSILSAQLTESNNISIIGRYEWDIKVGENEFVANFLQVLGQYDMYLGNISIDSISSINHLGDPSVFKVFPNPSRGEFTVQKDPDFTFPKNVNYKIFNLEGKVIRSGTFGNQGFQIEETIAETGIYILQVIADQKTYLKRIVVQ